MLFDNTHHNRQVSVRVRARVRARVIAYSSALGRSPSMCLLFCYGLDMYSRLGIAYFLLWFVAFSAFA